MGKLSSLIQPGSLPAFSCLLFPTTRSSCGGRREKRSPWSVCKHSTPQGRLLWGGMRSTKDSGCLSLRQTSSSFSLQNSKSDLNFRMYLVSCWLVWTETCCPLRRRRLLVAQWHKFSELLSSVKSQQLHFYRTLPCCIGAKEGPLTIMFAKFIMDFCQLVITLTLAWTEEATLAF